jgi:hypothetical protein
VVRCLLFAAGAADVIEVRVNRLDRLEEGVCEILARAQEQGAAA